MLITVQIMALRIRTRMTGLQTPMVNLGGVPLEMSNLTIQNQINEVSKCTILIFFTMEHSRGF